MTALQTVAIVVSITIGVSGLGAMVWAFIHVKGTEITMKLITNGNDELRKELAHERETRIHEREKFTRDIADERVECARSIAKIEGQIQALTDGLAERIITATISAIQTVDRRKGSLITSKE